MFLVRSKTLYVLSFTLVLASAETAFASIQCDALAPERPLESELRAELEGGTGGTLLKALGSVEFEGEFEKVERDILDKYPNADKLHMFGSVIYVLCGLLNSSSLSDVEKFDKFESLTSKWANIGSSVIVDQVQSDDLLQKKSAIESGLRHPDSFIREVAIESALNAKQNSLKSLALKYILLNQKSFGGFLCLDQDPSKRCGVPFSFDIDTTSSQGNSVTFSGEFNGSIYPHEGRDKLSGSGTLSGTKLSVNTEICSLEASFEEGGEFVGAFDCGRFQIGAEAVYGSFPVVLKFY